MNFNFSLAQDNFLCYNQLKGVDFMSKSTDYKNKFISENYDRINLTVPKGFKEKIASRAEKLDLSVNGYINELIKKDFDSPVLNKVEERKNLEVFLL